MLQLDFFYSAGEILKKWFYEIFHTESQFSRIFKVDFLETYASDRPNLKIKSTEQNVLYKVLKLDFFYSACEIHKKKFYEILHTKSRFSQNWRIGPTKKVFFVTYTLCFICS